MSDDDVVKVDLSNAKMVNVLNKEDLIDFLRSGQVVAIDKNTGSFLSELYGVPLPKADRVIENVLLAARSKK